MSTEPPRDVAALWSDPGYTRVLEKAQWMAAPEVLLYLNQRSTGDSSLDWLSGWAVRYFVGQNLRVLVLGCGEGWLERALAPVPFIDQIDAYDVAAGAVERARKTAEEMGLAKLHYGVLDLNTATLPLETYDVVIAHSILHHVERLEHAFAEIERTLKKDGTLIFNEYVGPSRFQMSDKQLGIMNEVLRSLPEELRRGVVEQPLYGKKERPTIDHMIRSDPSEAVRSSELFPLVSHRFDVLDRLDLGGTLLQHLLYDIVQNFDFYDSRKRSMLELLTILEGALIDSAALPSDFVALAARRKDSSQPRSAYSRSPLRAPAPRSEVERDPLGVGTLAAGHAERALAARRIAWLVRQLPGVSRMGIADPAVDESALAAALNDVRVERLSAGVTYDVIVTAAIDDTTRNPAHGGFLIAAESRLSEAAERDLPMDLIGRILRVVLLSERTPRRIHLGRSRLREAAERWRYRRWSKRRGPQFLGSSVPRSLGAGVAAHPPRNRGTEELRAAFSAPPTQERGFIRIGSVPRSSAPFDYIASRWQPSDPQQALPLIDLLCCFERVAVQEQLLSPLSTWVAWRKM
jgi:Methyltransferase domain